MSGHARPARRRLIVGSAVAGAAALVIGLARASRPDGDALLGRAQEDFRAGRLGAATTVLDRLARRRPPTALDRFLRAQVEAARGRHDLARHHLEPIGDDEPIAPLARLLQGQAEVKVGRLRAAEAAFRRAVVIQPRFVQAHRELAYIYCLQHRFDELDAELDALSGLGELPASYVLHWTKMRNTNWDAAKDVDELRRFVRADPDDRASRVALAEALVKLGRLDEAAGVAAMLPTDDPRSISIRARLALERGDRVALDSILGASPADEPSLAVVRAELAVLRGDKLAALDAYRIAERGASFDRRVAAGLGRVLTLLGREAEAEPYLARVRGHDRLGQLVARATASEAAHDLDLRVELGRACADLGRAAEARAWFESAIAENPLHAGAQRALATLPTR